MVYVGWAARRVEGEQGSGASTAMDATATSFRLLDAAWEDVVP